MIVYHVVLKVELPEDGKLQPAQLGKKIAKCADHHLRELGTPLIVEHLLTTEQKDPI